MSTLHSGSRCLKDAARLPTLCASLRAPPALWTSPPRPQPPSRHQQARAASSVAAPPAEATSSSVIQRLAGDIRAGDRSAVEVTEQYLEELHAREPELHSFITVDADGARAQVSSDPDPGVCKLCARKTTWRNTRLSSARPTHTGVQ